MKKFIGFKNGLLQPEKFVLGNHVYICERKLKKILCKKQEIFGVYVDNDFKGYYYMSETYCENIGGNRVFLIRSKRYKNTLSPRFLKNFSFTRPDIIGLVHENGRMEVTT